MKKEWSIVVSDWYNETVNISSNTQKGGFDITINDKVSNIADEDDVLYNATSIESISEVDESLEVHYKTLTDIADSIGYVDKDGNYGPSTTGALATTKKIPVKEGEILQSNGTDNHL
jgi:hypothetical protein